MSHKYEKFKCDNVDTNQQRILDEAIIEIKKDAEADTDLLDILMKHIITLSPADDAVEKAANEIKKLAEGRAKI